MRLIPPQFTRISSHASVLNQLPMKSKPCVSFSIPTRTVIHTSAELDCNIRSVCVCPSAARAEMLSLGSFME